MLSIDFIRGGHCKYNRFCRAFILLNHTVHNSINDSRLHFKSTTVYLSIEFGAPPEKIINTLYSPINCAITWYCVLQQWRDRCNMTLNIFKCLKSFKSGNYYAQRIYILIDLDHYLIIEISRKTNNFPLLADAPYFNQSYE